MKIFNVPPAEALWELVKPLAEEIPVYKEVMDEDENSVPDSYLLLRTDVSDNGKLYGDGEAVLRLSDCDIILVSKGTAATTDCLHNVNRRKVESRLREEGCDFYGNNLGYNEAIKSTQYTWSIEVVYGRGN